MAIPNEDELLAHLDVLEKGGPLKKGGDALQSAPHDGGFATEGTNIQSKAAKKVLKALMKGGLSKSAAKKMMKAMNESSSSSEEVEKGLDGDDDSSSEDESSAMSSDDDSSDAGSGDEDSSSEAEGAGGPPMMKKGKLNKSQGAAQLANSASSRGRREGTIRKALTDEMPEAGGNIDAVPILDKLIRTLDKGQDISKSDMQDLRKSIVRGHASQTEFNGKVAKALSILCGAVNDTRNLVKSISEQPAPRNSRQLAKSDLRQPSFEAGTEQIDGRGEQSPLVTNGIPLLKIQEALVDMCMKGNADMMDVTKFENAKGNLDVLPPQVVKQLETRLCSAS